MKQENLIFLISQPRSGSTLLQRIIGNHKDVYTRSEPWIMLHSAYSLKQKDMETSYNIKTWKTAFNDFINHLPTDGRDEYINELRQMHLNLYSKYSNTSNKKFFLDKTPRYYEIIDEIKEIFPQSKMILLLRNPLSVLSSILSTWVKGNYFTLNNYKVDLIDAIDIHITEILNLDTNSHIVKYEDLLLNPHISIEQICLYLQLDFTPELLDYQKNDISNWVYGDPINAKNKNKIDNTHIEKWMQNIRDPQIWRFFYDYLHMIGKIKFTQLGYDYENDLALLLDNIPSESLESLCNSTESLGHFINNKNINTSYSFAKHYNAFFEKIEKLKIKDLRYMLYGNGTIGKTIKALMQDKIVGYVDISDKEHHPSNLKDKNYDKIIISVLGRENEIIKYLTEDLNVNCDKIITFDIQ